MSETHSFLERAWHRNPFDSDLARAHSAYAGYDGAEDHQVLVDALERLPEREQRILHLRYVDGLTQSQIAEQIGVSQMHVSRLLTASIARLRESFTES